MSVTQTKLREYQPELFETNIFEIVEGKHYGRYGVRMYNILMAEFFSLDVACNFIVSKAKGEHFSDYQSQWIADESLKNYRQMEDKKCENV